jgi:hypothetical protein
MIDNFVAHLYFKTKIHEDTNFEALGKLGDLGLGIL